MATINKSNRAGLEFTLSPVVDITGVCKQYGEIQALMDVDLRVQSGVTGVLGPNGSGKSTLIKALLGLVHTQAGSGSVLGHPWPGHVRVIRDKVGYLPEDDCYIAGLVGIESVAFMARLSGLPGTEGLRRAHEIMDFCDIGEERYREVETYSTGMRQKLKFAQALVHDPPLLILDEPTTGLDPDQRQSMLSRIKTLAREHGKTVMLSTHILPDVRSVCDQVVMLVRGTVRLADSLDNLSRPIEPTVHVTVYGDSRGLVDLVRRQGHEVTVDADGSLRIGGVSAEQASLIWSWAAETGTAIRRLEPAVNSLDKIFFDAAGARDPRSLHDSNREPDHAGS
jgi:ABC-2 type transport system ATP-binding protein